MWFISLICRTIHHPAAAKTGLQRTTKKERNNNRTCFIRNIGAAKLKSWFGFSENTHTHTYTSFFIPFTQHTPNTRGRVQHSCDKTSPTHASVSQINTLRVCWFLLHLIICWRWKTGRVVPRAAVVRFWRCGNLKYHVFRVRRRRLWNVFAFSCRAGIYFLCEQHFRTSRKTYVNKINRKIFMV